jgi:sn-glycerol 3-phosphate transport system permease protein
MSVRKSGKILLFLANLLVAAVLVAPLLYALSASFMTEAELINYPPALIPSSFYTRNYAEALRLAPIFRFIFNSAVVSVACTAAQLITGALAGYAFGVLKFKGQKVLFFLMLATMMIPGQAIIIANYLMVVNLGLIDTFGALILPYTASAFCIFNMRQAFLSLPKELNESAMIDGCNSLQYFVKVGLPLTKPFLGSLGIYTFLSVWNQYLWPLLVTNSVNMRTVQIGIGMLQNAEGNAYGPIMAAAIMILVPSILIFIIGQKSLISGLTAGAVKG